MAVKLSYVQGSYNIDDYVTDIDSHISNITNTDNMQEGSLVDPANNIFKTVRVEEGWNGSNRRQCTF